MNLHFFGSFIDATPDELNEPLKHPVVYVNLVESLDEGGEYADDGLRMAEQAFRDQ